MGIVLSAAARARHKMQRMSEIPATFHVNIWHVLPWDTHLRAQPAAVAIPLVLTNAVMAAVRLFRMYVLVGGANPCSMPSKYGEPGVVGVEVDEHGELVEFVVVVDVLLVGVAAVAFVRVLVVFGLLVVGAVGMVAVDVAVLARAASAVVVAVVEAVEVAVVAVVGVVVAVVVFVIGAPLW